MGLVPRSRPIVNSYCLSELDRRTARIWRIRFHSFFLIPFVSTDNNLLTIQIYKLGLATLVNQRAAMAPTALVCDVISLIV